MLLKNKKIYNIDIGDYLQIRKVIIQWFLKVIEK